MLTGGKLEPPTDKRLLLLMLNMLLVRSAPLPGCC
jgi:hypothetical protein